MFIYRLIVMLFLDFLFIEDSLATVSGVHQAVKLGILKLLSICVDNPSPNIAHLLLGYETSMEKHVSETTLQDPGNYFSYSCLSYITDCTSHVSFNGVCHVTRWPSG